LQHTELAAKQTTKPVKKSKNKMNYENILIETRGRVGLITLNRPKALNALNDQLMDEVGHALLAFDANHEIGCMVITGSEKAFAAGADISAMAKFTYPAVMQDNFITRNWETINRIRKPVIAAVSGFALGGGCELAMMCDFIIASDTAKFGQPEIKIGIMPGAGGTQRLPRAVSKSKAMDMCLTARMMDAQEAERAGLVSRVVAADQLMIETMKAADTIAQYPLAAVLLIKESVNQAYQTPLADGVLYERRVFHSLFATEDQKEGMTAFLEKRAPKFSNN
jgi:enoyl-CoA hydratase